MAEYITLLGAEEVSRAASNMKDVASTMAQAASSMAFTIEQNQRFLDDWLGRLDDTLSNRIQQLSVVTGAQ